MKALKDLWSIFYFTSKLFTSMPQFLSDMDYTGIDLGFQIFREKKIGWPLTHFTTEHFFFI
jgi:hypothetical protein